MEMNPYDGLLNYSYEFFTGKSQHMLDCWLEYEEADPESGLKESFTLCYAELNGVDISELLSEEVKTEIIEQTQLAYESLAGEDYYD